MIEIQKKLILEKLKNASSIRMLVRDIITMYKREDDGEFYLPEDLNDDGELEYNFSNSPISVELFIEPSENVNDFLANANYDKENDIISVKIVYNPEKKHNVLYNLIGELNELIAHELRHQYQRDYGLYDLGDEEEEKEGFEYYSQDHEIDAQVEGFKRMRDITRRPFEELVRNWFRTHQEIHHMNPEDTKKVIDLILNHYRQS